MKKPIIQPINELRIPKIESYKLSNGIHLNLLPKKGFGLLKMDVVVEAGRPQEHKKLVSKATGDILAMGTKNRTRKAIADYIDYRGASLGSQGETDASIVTMFCQTAYALDMIHLVMEILNEPAFRSEVLSQYVDQMIALLDEDLHNSDVVAYRAITEDIYGKEHPYGYNSSPALYRSLSTADLMDMHRMFYNAGNIHVILSGDIKDMHIRAIEKGMDGEPQEICKSTHNFHAAEVQPGNRTISVGKQASFQTSIRVGRRLFDRSDKDFYQLYFLNLILGGYFGSRLTKILRERDAITYDIHSFLESLRYDGIFLIACEVRSGKEEVVIAEVKKVLDDLKHTDISEYEISLARNYLLGQYLLLTDGPLNVSEYLKQMLSEGRDIRELERFNAALGGIVARDLRILARRIFDWDTFHVVSVY